jgi:hypothetical protein
MDAAQICLVAGGFLLASATMVVAMNRALRRERDYMHRRRQAWIDAGSIPEDEPKFYSGCSGGGG